jgi:hypothetical protein
MRALAISVLALIAVVGLCLLTWPAPTIAFLAEIIWEAFRQVVAFSLLVFLIVWVAAAVVVPFLRRKL